MYGNDLTGSIPSSLGSTNLQYLSLEDNQLTGTIPVELANLGTLNQINLNNNQLDEVIPNFSAATNLRRLAIERNQLTFEDLLPNSNTIETLISNNTDPNDDHNKYQYQTQNLVGAPTSINFMAGQNHIFDLEIDDTVTTNVYKWYKNGTLFQTNTGNNTLSLTNVTTADIGIYTCEITNPAIPDLTLESHPYRLVVIDPDCRMKDSLVLADLYNATGGANWTNTWDLNQPMTTWYGITLNIDGCVETVDLDGFLAPNCEECHHGGNNLNGMLPSNFWDLKNLGKLSLGGNHNLNLTMPAAIGDLIELKILNLGSTQLTGTIPTEIGNLTQLKSLTLWGGQLTGAIPSSLNNLIQLEKLLLENNQLTSIPYLGSLTKLSALVISSNPFNTNFPDWIGELTEIAELQARNNGWTGSLPPSMGNLPKLFFLFLDDNQLTGVIPNSFSNLQQLAVLSLSNNQLEGVFPATVANLPILEHVILGGNNFSGTIPDFTVSSIRNLQLENNQFTFKDILPNLAANETAILNNNGGNTMYDSLRYNPQQEIATPTNLDFTTGDNKLLSLNIDNFITSNIYTWFKGDLPFQTINGNSNLSLSNLSESDAGVYTCKVTNPNAPDLTLESHPFTLSFVDPSCRMRDSLILVDLYNATGGPNWTTTWDLNQPMDTWHGVFLNEFGCVTRLDMDGDVDINFVQGIGNGNNLMNTIPASLWNLSELRTLSFANNRLSTPSFPSELVNLIKLAYLNFARVKLNGAIPTNIDQLTNLTSLTFRFCDLNGAIPEQIGNMTALTALNLEGNNLTGNIPYGLTNLVNLTSLNLSGNNLTNLTDLSNLKELNGLDLSFNSFGGTIPEWISNLPELINLYLRGDQFTGNIPDFWASLPNLQFLDLGFNELTGSVPTSLLNTDINFLDLNDNQLTGDFPTFLSTIPSLSYLYLYNNSFEGLIPDFSVQASTLIDLEIRHNQFTFEDIIPHFAANQNLINTNSPNSFHNYKYQSQAKIGTPTSENFVEGMNCSFNLGIDDTVMTNTYQWFKNGQPFQTIQGNNTLVLNNVTSDDVGTYICAVTNSIVPDLTLESHPYSLVVSDPDCRMKDSLVLVELYNATNGANWFDAWDLSQPMTTWFGVELNVNGCVSVLDLDGFIGDCLPCWNSSNMNGTIPNSIWNLKNLTALTFAGGNLNATIPDNIEELNQLAILSFFNVNLSDGLPNEIENLAQLTHLYLNDTQLSGAIPSTFANLLNLKVLALDRNQFNSIPDLSNLNELQELSLTDNPFNSTLPNWLGNLAALSNFYAHGCGWIGNLPSNLGNLSQLSALGLNHNQLTGIIPNNFSNLNLNSLALSHNQLSGPIPDFLNNMASLNIKGFLTKILLWN